MRNGFATLLFFAAVLFLAALFPYPPPFETAVPPEIADFSVDAEQFSAVFPFTFGGRILFVTPCTCSGGFRIEVVGPRPMDLLFQPGVSQLFAFYSPTPGANVLGTYTPDGVCLTGIPPACAPLPVLGTVLLMGTSGGI